MSMTKHRHDQILASQLSSAQKVYECIPCADAWTTQQITSELFRRGIRQDGKHISGCLSALVDAGLVRQAGRDKYRRIYSFPLVEAPKQQQKLTTQPPPPKPEPEPMAEAPSKPAAAAQPTTDQSAKTSDPLVRLLQHADYLRRLADDIELAAMEAQQQNEEAKKNGSRFERLRSLLKEVTE